MTYLSPIRAAFDDPQSLETLYQTARQEHNADAFVTDLLTCYEGARDNLLYAAWYYRLTASAPEAPVERRGVNWRLAVPLSVLSGLVCWLLSDERLQLVEDRQLMTTYLAPIILLAGLSFLGLASQANRKRVGPAALGLIAACVYVPLIVSARDVPYRQNYVDLMTVHLPLIAWAAIGILVMGVSSPPGERFAFLLKSFEVFVTGGIFLIGGGIFISVTQSLFSALNIDLPDAIRRLLNYGVMAAIPVLAFANAYDPLLRPKAQDFKAGLGRLLAALTRLLLFPTLIVLAVYVVAIFTNFSGPFKSRDVLSAYHVMLFAVLTLLIGATPMKEDDVPVRFRPALRFGLVAVAGLAGLVGLYALAAIVYRTIQDDLTMNRLALMGWDAINVGVLASLINRQYNLGRRAEKWVADMHVAFNLGAIGYALWAVLVTVMVPLVIR